MGLEVTGPVLVLGIGGAGSRLAAGAAGRLGADHAVISNDGRDLGDGGILVSTAPVINPTVRLIRGRTYAEAGPIRERIAGHRTVIMMAGLAGRAGAAMAPAVAEMCREEGAGLVSFAIMPFGFEGDRLFDAGVSLRRVREGSDCTIVLDNDALLQANPDLTMAECRAIANSAVLHVAGSLAPAGAAGGGVISAGRPGLGMEDSLRDSLKMLYGSAPPGSAAGSMLYVTGGDGVPVGLVRSVSDLAACMTGGGVPHVEGAGEAGTVMLTAVRDMSKFEAYDPLGAIPAEDTLDWDAPECDTGCDLGLYQME